MKDRLRRNARWLLVTAAVTIVAATVAWALLSTRQDVPSTVNMQNVPHEVVWTPAADLLTVVDMTPGDVVYRLATGNRATAGTSAVDIMALASNADGLGLRDQLVLTIRDHANAAGFCDAANFTGTGSTVYTGPVGADPEVALVTNGPMVPDPTDNQNYCFKMELPVTTGVAFAGASTDITIGFVVHD